MNQTWENDKKPGFEPDFDKFFLWFLPLLEPNQTWESGKKNLVFGQILAHLALIQAIKFF